MNNNINNNKIYKRKDYRRTELQTLLVSRLVSFVTLNVRKTSKGHITSMNKLLRSVKRDRQRRVKGNNRKFFEHNPTVESNGGRTAYSSIPNQIYTN